MNKSIRKAIICGSLIASMTGTILAFAGCGDSHHDESSETTSPTPAPTADPTSDPTSQPTSDPTPDPDKISYIDPIDYDNDYIPYSNYKVVIKNVPPHRPNLPVLSYGGHGQTQIEEGYYNYSDRTFTFIIPDEASNKSITKVELDNASYSTGSIGMNPYDGGEDPETAVEADVPYELDYNDFTITPTPYIIWIRSNTETGGYEGSDLFNLSQQGAKFTMEYVADGKTYTTEGSVVEYKHTRYGDGHKDLVAREGFVLDFYTVKAKEPYIIINKITAGDKHYYGQVKVNYAANKDGSHIEFTVDSANHKYPKLLHLFELNLNDFQ